MLAELKQAILKFLFQGAFDKMEIHYFPIAFLVSNVKKICKIRYTLSQKVSNKMFSNFGPVIKRNSWLISTKVIELLQENSTTKTNTKE